MSEPGYWMFETTGKLAPAVKAYLEGQPLAEKDIAALRAYLRQWIFASVWVPSVQLHDLRRRIDTLVTREAVTRWLNDAMREGIDPL